MGRDLNPKCKQCRRIGEKLFLKGERCNTPKCAMVKRNYPPGVHGQKGYPRLSPFGSQLREKQKLKKIYRLSERQFKLIFNRAARKKGNTGEILLKLLETRVDNVIFRLGFADSRDQARQLVNHGHFLVNNRSVNIPSYTLKVGDKIRVKPNCINKIYWQERRKSLEQYKAPSWLALDKKELMGEVLALPSKKELPEDVQTELVVEYYSR